jgi:hypothetical protein
MGEEPEITPEQLATFRRCTFARRVFVSYPSLWAKKPMPADDLPPDSREGEWHVSKPYTGEPFDPEEWELREGGWDHEHCKRVLGQGDGRDGVLAERGPGRRSGRSVRGVLPASDGPPG